MIFAFVLSAVNPKNMLLSLTAGVSVGALNLSGGQETTATIILALSLVVQFMSLPLLFYWLGVNLTTY